MYGPPSALAMIVAVTMSVVGCAPPDNPGRRQEAVELAERYLSAISGGEPDRGWSLLMASTRELWETEEAFIAAAEEADWSRFEFVVLEAMYCDDGVICPVALNLPNGPDSVPALRGAPEHWPPAGILFRDEAFEGMPGNAEISIVLPDLLRGPGGVAPAGG